MFDMESRTTIVKSVVEMSDSGIELADSTADSATTPLRIGLWVRAFRSMEAMLTLRNARVTLFWVIQDSAHAD